MEALYDNVGKSYSVSRCEDPKIAEDIFQFLLGSDSILNIGAGTGSYEPREMNVIAVEPSMEMIQQRAKDSAPVKQAYAELLPFDDDAFSHTMTVLSMHHWADREAAFAEIKRVTTKRFVAVTWNPSAEPYWLTDDYFPEIHIVDRSIFPSLDEMRNHFPGVRFYTLEIPKDCIDGFTAAYWARPRQYLDATVRSGMSTFSKINGVDEGLKKLEADLESGLWNKKYGYLQDENQLNVGYTIAVWDAK